MNKLFYLEGVRGIAAFIVVVSHFVQVFYPALLNLDLNQMHNGFEGSIPQTPLNILYNGNFAVCIFFVLSGYVLSYKFIMKKENDILVESAVKRYFRLAIPVATSVLFAYLILRLDLFYYGYVTAHTFSTMPDFYAMEPSFLEAIKQGFYGAFFENEFSYNAVLWTIYYELIGSFIVFSFLALFSNIRHRYIFYIVLLILFWNTYFIAFVLGMMLCDINNSNVNNFSKIISSKLSVIFTLIIGLYFASFPYVNVEGTIYEFLVIEGLNIDYFMMYHIFGAVLVLVAMLGSDVLQKLFSVKIFRFLGNISFSLYLIHFTIICSFSSYIFIRFINKGMSYNVSFLITFFTSMILIFILSYLMYKYVDSKSVKWSKWIYTNIFQKK